MQIHTPSSLPSNDDFRVHLNEAARVPFAIIDLDDIGTRIFVENLADADRLIKAAVEAKRLLSPPEPPDPDICKCGHPGYQHVYAEPERCTQCECKAFTAAPSGGVMFGPFSPEDEDAPGFDCNCGRRLPWPARVQDETCPSCGQVWEYSPDHGGGARLKSETAASAS